jgi:hypothetical protein
MNNDVIEIHEFSTGIKVGRNSDGSWVSLGFTGRFINSTFKDSIPHVVERSIANEEFMIREGTASDNPAIVGRVVGMNTDPWSVVAVISKGRDEKGRSGSFHRYFLSKGEDKIPSILDWLESNRDSVTSFVKVFNPDDPPANNLPYSYSMVEDVISRQLPPKLEQLKNENNLPIIIDSKIKDFKLIHQLTVAKVSDEENRGIALPVSWAFNVEVVEHINKFVVVHPANDSASEILRKMRVSAALSAPASLFDEQALKAAIKNITNSSNIKDEHFTNFADALLNEQISEKNWIKILDGQGAKNALSQGIYTPQMIRLVILRAIIIPSALPEYFKWIQVKDKKSSEKEVANTFEKVISNKIDTLNTDSKSKIYDCIDNGSSTFIAKVAENAVSTNVAREFLVNKEGLWGKNANNFLKKFHQDLNKMESYAKNKDTSIFELNSPTWVHFRSEILQFWNPRNPQFDKKYLRFANIFENVSPLSISMIFYYMSNQDVPYKLAKRISQFRPSVRANLYGLWVERELNFIETLEEILIHCKRWMIYKPHDRLGENSMTRIAAIGWMIITFVLGGISGYFFSDISSKSTIVPSAQPSPSNGTNAPASTVARNNLQDSTQITDAIYKLYEKESLKNLPSPQQKDREAVRENNLSILNPESKDKITDILKSVAKLPDSKVRETIKTKVNSMPPAEIDNLRNDLRSAQLIQ